MIQLKSELRSHGWKENKQLRTSTTMNWRSAAFDQFLEGQVDQFLDGLVDQMNIRSWDEKNSQNNFVRRKKCLFH